MEKMAEILGLAGASSYQHYEKHYGKRYLPADLMEKLRPALLQRGISAQDIDALWLPRQDVAPTKEKIVYAPLISWVEAGGFVDAPDSHKLEHYEELIPIASPTDTVFLLRVRGNSINRVAPDGSLIVVDYADTDLVNKRFYLLRKGEEMTVKQYQADPVAFVPASTDPDYPVILPSADLEVVGRIRRVVTEL